MAVGPAFGMCFLASCVLSADAFSISSWWNLVPRKTVPYNELKDVMRHFSSVGVSNYTTLTLADSDGLLYIGAREAIFALSTSNMELQDMILWEAPAEKKTECIQKGKSNQTDCFNYIRLLQPYNSSHMYTCGTYAFQPKCAYIDVATFSLDRQSFEDGKGKCPYDPAKGHTGLIVEEELYSATLYNFLGTEPVILRNLGPQYSVKTEHLSTWLNEPHFVGSAFVQESKGSDNGDDDKVYFLFSERAVEYDCDIDQVVARVARVCKGDVGGARTLQKRWTTFLKARLLCSIPEQQLHFTRMQGSFTLNGDHCFCLCSLCRGDVDVSAVCQYEILDVQKVFDGPYKEYSEIAQKWIRYSDKEIVPRPGAVSRRSGSSQYCPREQEVGLFLLFCYYFGRMDAGVPCDVLVLFSCRTSVLIQDFGTEPALCRPLRATRPGTKVVAKNVTVMVGTDLVLPCRLTSNLAKALWTFNGQELPEEQTSVLYDAHLQALIILGVSMRHGGKYRCVQLEELNELMSENYVVTVVSGSATSLEARAPLENLGLVWMVVIALSAVCLVLLLVVLSLRRRLKEELEKGSKTIESTLVYPIEMPKEAKSPTFIPSTTSDSDEKLWDPASYYYSDGSLKIVPGHAVCQNGGTTPSPTANGIPGQPLQSPPLHSPNRINLGNIRGSSSNGYIRLNLGAEERPDYSDLAEELRRKLKQRQALPDSNPEESSV
nr:PREDICTED: semaphorin-4C [Anolis carolinensis]|eukprot:XP_016852893.1 PREDICTED: semaphorin-4C [Anolis carolinensis]